MLDRLFSHPASIVLLIVILVVLLGSKRLPDVARSLGRSTRILKSEVDEMRRESEAGTETTATTRRESDETPTAPSLHEGTRE